MGVLSGCSIIARKTLHAPWPELILDDFSLARACAHLAEADPVFAKMTEAAGSAPLRRSEPGFAGLLRIIIGQQISATAANTLYARLVETFAGELHPKILAETSDQEFRACGLSRPKIKTIRALAEILASGAFDLANLDPFSPDKTEEALCALHGIGPWTAQVYLLFCLGAPDVFPSGDLAIQEAARLALDLETRPDAKNLARIAQRWRPLRAVAARQLWAYYRHCKQREGVAGA